MFSCCMPHRQKTAGTSHADSETEELVLIRTHVALAEVLPVLPVKPVPNRSASFTVVVPTKGFSTLGLQMELTDQRAPMVLGIEDGAVQEFNKTYKGASIRPLDVLFALDGIQSWETIQRRMTGELPEKLFVTIKRPKKVEIVVEKTKNMGITLAHSEDSVGVLVQKVAQSSFEWDAEGRTHRLDVWDRIIEFEGKPYPGTELAKLLEERSHWRLTVLKYDGMGDVPVEDRVMEGLSRCSFL